MKKISLFLFSIFYVLNAQAADPKPSPAPSKRMASIYVSQDFINEQLAAHGKSDLFQSMKVELDADKAEIFLRGTIQVPVDQLRAVNLDPSLGAFHFQASIKPKATKQGHLILEFPLAETFFYPLNSKDPERERVIVPVQMLSLALASVRGYLAAISGDFSGFDRKQAKLTALEKDLDHSIEREKNADALDDLKTQRESIHLQLESLPLERKQLLALSKQVGNILGFTGEKEIHINDELAAHKNALILKIKLSQLAPYLKNVELGGLRILHDKKDGNGENYLAIDVDSTLDIPPTPTIVAPPSQHAGLKVAPLLIMRLRQALFESEAVTELEKENMSSKVRNLKFALKDDGVHVTGSWHAFLFSIPFETIVDFVSTGKDVFEVRVREMQVAGLDVEFLTKLILESMKKRLDQALNGICQFEYVGEVQDHSRALQVTVNNKALIPASPDLHLIDVDVREREFLLKIGH